MPYEIYDLWAGAPDGSFDNDLLEAQGWEESIGVGGSDSVMYIQSYRRDVDGRTEWIVHVSDILGGTPYIKVDGPGELMDLLARWAPAVQAAAVTHVLDDIRKSHLDPDGVVETIAAKVGFGQDETVPMLRRQLREQRARGRELRAKREAARQAPQR